jgi:hypothetical protein
METAGNLKVVYVRAGTYANTALTLTAADNGETWSYYPSDGYDSAILDGGSTSVTTGGTPFLIRGASNVTINGLTIQNFLPWGIGIFTGNGETVSPSSVDVGAANNITIKNNVFNNGYVNEGGNVNWSGGAVHAIGQVSNLTIDHNVATNQYGSCFRVQSDVDEAHPNDSISGLIISNNACLVSNMATADNGAIYTQDLVSTQIAGGPSSVNITIFNNFVRDYQTTTALRTSHSPAFDAAIYLDQGSANVTVAGNIIANTAYPLAVSGTNNTTAAFYSSYPHNVEWVGNIVDLGTAGIIQPFMFALNQSEFGDLITQNILIGNWSGAQTSEGSGYGGYSYPTTCCAVYGFPSVTNNLYYNYGGGAISTTGEEFSDSAPVTGVDPLISGTTYNLATTSPAYTNAVAFPGIVGGWGPPGYVIPSTGTAPSP